MRAILVAAGACCALHLGLAAALAGLWSGNAALAGAILAITLIGGAVAIRVRRSEEVADADGG
jgi:hypothetical protein